MGGIIVNETHLLGVQIESTEGQSLDYGILEATEGAFRLITPRLKGTLLGGGTLVLFSSLYYGVLIVSFLYLHLTPITQWDLLPRALFVVAIPAGFLVIVFLGLGWVRKLQVKYQKTSLSVRILEIHPGHFRHEVVVESGGKRFVLTTTGRKSKLFGAMALGKQGESRGS